MRMVHEILFTLCYAVLASYTAAQNTNSCYSNETKCLLHVRELLVDTDKFWFGSSFNTSCPDGPGSSLECTNSDPTKRSILSRLLSLNDTDLTTLNEIAGNISLANITYTAPAGNYTSCGQDYDVPALNGYLVDPLSVTRVSLWSLSFRPSVTWKPKTPGSLETLVIWDPGFSYNHGLYINCVNGSIDTGEAVRTYMGPRNPVPRVNTYIFAVYTQSSRIDINHAKKSIEGQGVYEPAEFIANFTTQNNYPTHAGILTILADPYSIQKIYDRLYMANNCPYLISQLDTFHTVIRASNLSVPWSDNSTTLSLYNNGTYLTSLAINIDVRYSTDDFTVESCCTNYSLTRGSTLVNPFNTSTLRPGNVRLKPVVQFTPIDIQAFEGIEEDTYTLFLLDVAAAMVPGAQNPTYVTHWLVTNIRNADVVRGDEVAAYFGPNPFTPNEHRPYMFLLFRQPVPKLNNTVFNTFCTNGTMRCRTQLKPVLDAWNLTELVGVTWFLAEQDAFARYRLYSVLNAMPKDSACKGVPGYAEPCPQACTGKQNSGTAHRPGCFLAFVFLFAVANYFNIV